MNLIAPVNDNEDFVKKNRMMDYCVFLSDLGIVKPGEHWCPNMNLQEAIADTESYIKGTGWAGRVGFEYFNNGKWQIAHIGDVSEHAERIGKFKPHAKWDEASVFKDIDLSRSDNKRETFNMSLEEYMRHRNNVVHGSSNIATFAPHKFQQEAIDKAVNFFKQGGTDFLLDAFTRFGKSFDAYKTAKGCNTKRVLVITGRPKVKAAWKRDLDHIDFEGWRFIDSQTTDNVKFFEPHPGSLFEEEVPVCEVIFASFQGGKRAESRIAQVIDQDIDMIIIDEAHAYFSENAISFVMQLKAEWRLWVSGTPFKAYDSGMFNGETDTYRFTLQDVLREKASVEKKLANGELCDSNELRYTEFPNVQILVADYPEFEKDELYNEENLSMKALLSNNDGIPNYPDEINGLLDSLLSTTHRSALTMGGREIKYPVNPQHVWFAVPAGKDDTNKQSVAAAISLETCLNNHELFNQRFNPLAIRGDKEEKDVNQHIEKSKRENKGTVNISCRSLNTGTTFPDMNVVVWLNETTSAAEFWQTNGRIFNPKEGKESVTIICYSVEMAVTMANKMVEYSDKGQGHNELMKEFLSMVPVYVKEGPRVRSLDINEVYTQLSVKGSMTKSFRDRTVLSSDFANLVLDNPKWFEEMIDVESDKEPTSNKFTLHKSQDKGTNAKQTRANQATKQEKDLVKESMRKVQEFMTLTGSIMAASLLYKGYLITSSDDLRGMDPDLINSELYPGTYEILMQLIDCGAINVNRLDSKISGFYNVELKDKVHV